MSREHDIIAWLLHNQFTIKMLCKPHIDLYKTLVSSDDIDKYHKETLILVVSSKLIEILKVTNDEVRQVLINLNWDEYLQ